MIILRNKNYSDKEPTIRIGRWWNKQKFSDLSDKQLENIANWSEEEHPGYEKGISQLLKKWGNKSHERNAKFAKDELAKRKKRNK